MSVTMFRPNTLKPPIGSLCFDANKIKTQNLKLLGDLERKPLQHFLNETLDSFNVIDLPLLSNDKIRKDGNFSMKRKTFFKNGQICFTHEDIGYPAFSRRMTSLLLPVPFIQEFRVASYLIDLVDTPIVIHLSYSTELPYGSGRSLSFAKSEVVHFNFTFPLDSPFAKKTAIIASRYPNSPIVTHTRISTEILPHPFPSNCRIYSDSGYQSRAHCFNDCVLRKMILDIGRVPGDMLITKPFTGYTLSLKERSDQDNNLDNWTEICENSCSQRECTRIDFLPRLIGWRTKDLNYFRVYLVIPGEPDIESIMSPAVTLIDVITFISGSVSFWFGLAFYTFLSRSLPVVSSTNRLVFFWRKFQFQKKISDINSLEFRKHLLRQKLKSWTEHAFKRYEDRRELMEQMISMALENKHERQVP
jgi:hypothetical protein